MSVEARAERYAALADPTRLRIVDLLQLGDASPALLQSRLGVGSNLLAHHLTHLSDAGIITRHRSEADRRRTYVHLEPEALDLAGSLPVLSAKRVMFVCTGNSARSQIAAALWARASDVPGVSAGTHPASAVAPGAMAVAERHGVTLANAAPRSLADVATGDELVVTVCDSAFEEIGDARLHWSIGDPVVLGTQRAFDEAFAQIASRVSHLARHVVQEGTSV
jgi:ArsR family transcriptional regulator, arsenate/arsenite/antimonite-responsive transcriptional repressor / arsenate reductase (thioredoxin)